ncbi:hypothetical protein [Sphingopyxis panaciterrulae]|uniref:Uncharacterized protein n=1 Tax=Sphingopyxis panaciterrulae TaxID=462372 RepID=A0A7W9B6Z5_9SPHN|nr:hypothetical protein [Sphingopyxis panaciterrulae]
MKQRAIEPDRDRLDLDLMFPLDRAGFEAAVATEAERRAFRWRFRLVGIESVMMAGLVLVAGRLVDQPVTIVARASVTVGVACFASGLLLIWLSSVTSALMIRLRRGRRS